VTAMPRLLISRSNFSLIAGLSTVVLRSVEPSDVLYYSKGPVSLRPQLGLTEAYNDNIFYSSKENEKADLVSTISPGFNLDLGRLEDNHLFLTYEYDQVLYADNTRLNTSQHLLDFATKLEGARLRLEGSDSIHFLSNLIGGGERSSIGDRNVDSTTYSDNYTLTYEISPKTSAYLGGNYSATDYEEGIGLYDVNTLTGTAGFGFKAFPNLAFFGEIYYGQQAVEPNFAGPKGPHADFVGGFLGARGNFTERLTGTLKLGYEDREFSDGTPTPSAPVVEISLTEKFTEKTSLSLAYARRTQSSVQFAAYSYTSDQASIELAQALGNTGKLEARVGSAFSMNEYEQTPTFAQRTDSYWSGYANLTYHIQTWLKATLGYDYQNFGSDAAGVIDYDVNRVTLRVAVGY